MNLEQDSRDSQSSQNNQNTSRDSSRPHQTLLRVRFPEVDMGGVVHHSVYLKYFEVGRSDWLRELGTPYREIQASGIHLVVTAAELNFHAAARYDDMLVISTHVRGVSRVRIVLAYEVHREADSTLLCRGETTLAALTTSWKPCALPAEILALGART